jgi:hypothetical protein
VAHVVATASFNFARAAEENKAEDLLVIEDGALAAEHARNWQRHFAHSTVYQRPDGPTPVAPRTLLCPIGRERRVPSSPEDAMLAGDRIIPLHLNSGELRQGVEYGNIAAWLCPCGRSVPLIGRTGDPEKPGQGFLIECSNCGRPFQIGVAEPHGRALVVNEVGETAAGSRR